MAAIIRPTNMAEAFMNATVKCVKSSQKVPWTAKHVIENCERDRAGLVREFNNINVTGTPSGAIDDRLQRNLPGLCGEFNWRRG